MADGLNVLHFNFSHIHILLTYTIEMLHVYGIVNVYPNNLNGHELRKMYCGNGGILVMMNKGWRQSCLSPKGVLYILILIAICQLPLMCLFVPSLGQCCLPIPFYLSRLALVTLLHRSVLCNYLFSLSCQHLCYLDTQSHGHYMGQHVLLSFVNKTISPIRK